MTPTAVHTPRRRRTPDAIRVARPARALVQVRLQRPDPGPQLLERPRLLEALSEHAGRALTVVVAEAGYGKTSLCASWVRRLRRPVVWYSLTPSDADLVVFGSTLLAGIRREFPRIGRSFQRALDEAKPGGRTAEMLAGTLVHELAGLRSARALLVLDDFQDVAAAAPVASFVELLLRDLPDSVRVLIASRTPPPVGLERLRARASLFELHSGHLRFTRVELQRLFDEVYRRPLSEAELSLLDDTTLGWPTAVHLVHESLRRRDGAALEQVLSDFRASRLELRDYLSSEVYARLDPESRRLLERTAVLPRFDAALAGQLTGMPRPDATLDALVRRGLLGAFGSGEHVSYECHELVRAFVRHELEGRLGADGLRDLHAEAAAALIGRGENEAALGHLLTAGHTTQAAAVLCEIGPGLLRQGRAAAVRGWLAELPAERLREDLQLALMQADAGQALGDWDQAERRYQEVLEMCRVGAPAGGAVPPRDIEWRVLVGLGKVMNLRGRHEQVLGMAERGLATARELELEARVRLMQMKAGAHFYLGQFKAAIEVLGQVRSQLEGTRAAELLVPTLHNLAIAHAAQGHYRAALEEFRVALAQVRGTDSPRAPLYLSNLAFLHADLGELAEARHAAEEGLAASQRFSNRAQECVCHQALAQILAASGDLDGALAALRSAEQLNGELRIQVIAADLLATRGRIFCARGEYRRAVEFMEQAIARAGERADAPRRLDFQAARAWCELRAGRVRVARDLLEPLVARADAGENDAQRTHVHYWYAEALLALHEPGRVEAHLRLALRLARERGYLHFLRVQAREEPAPLLHALGRGLEIDTVVAALVEAGPAIEGELLELLERAVPAVAEAAAAVLGEVGGAAALEGLEQSARHRRSLASAIRTARRHVAERLARGRPAAEGAEPGTRRLALFGPPRLLVDGQALPPASWRSQRAFQMLIYLALHPRGAGKEVLLERFWPGRQTVAGRRNFHPTLSYVRHVLPARPQAPILREGELYRLNPEYPLGCDAWEFEHALERARAEREPAARRAALEQAVTLASGPFLEGFYSDWADALQARMRDRLEKALLELADLHARAAEFEPALECFRRAAALDEYRESTRIAAIECLVRLGERRSALVEYERLKTTLRRELTIEPLPETEEAMQRLLRGEGVHGWPQGPAGFAQSKGPQEVLQSGQVGVNDP